MPRIDTCSFVIIVGSRKDLKCLISIESVDWGSLVLNETLKCGTSDNQINFPNEMIIRIMIFNWSYVSICATWFTWTRTWWRHQMETFSALLAICAGNSPVPGEFPAQRPVTRIFDVFFDLGLNKRLSKQSWGWWFETLSRPLWRHRDELREMSKGIKVWKPCILVIPRWSIEVNMDTQRSRICPRIYNYIHLYVQCIPTGTTYNQGLYSLRRRRLISIGIPIINLRRSSDRLRFIMGIPIPVRRRLLSE